VVVKPRSLAPNILSSEIASTTESVGMMSDLSKPSLFAAPRVESSAPDGQVFLDSQKRLPGHGTEPAMLPTPAASEPAPQPELATAQFTSQPGRGAWLTGTIEEASDAVPARTVSDAHFPISP
jgi:hypothetical protein